MLSHGNIYRYIHSKNRANLGYKLAVNRFADYYDEELMPTSGYRKEKKRDRPSSQSKTFRYGKSPFVNLPESIDWRGAGAVTPVQGTYIYLL